MARAIVKILNKPVDNLFINGGFDFWQRGVSFLTSGSNYSSDRWLKDDSSSSQNHVAQVAWSSSDAGFNESEGDYYLKVKSGNTNTGTLFFSQRIEDVKTHANGDITIAFRAKSATSETLSISIQQNFGSGGSTAVNAGGTTVELTPTWAIYNVTITLPSIAEKTIGTSSYLQVSLNISADGTTNPEWDCDWAMAVKGIGSISSFNKAGENNQGELAMCQRYFYAITYPDNSEQYDTLVHWRTTTAARGGYQHPVRMRGIPTVVFSGSNLNVQQGTSAIAGTGPATLSGSATNFRFGFNISTAAQVNGGGGILEGNVDGTSKISVDAEL